MCFIKKNNNPRIKKNTDKKAIGNLKSSEKTNSEKGSERKRDEEDFLLWDIVDDD